MRLPEGFDLHEEKPERPTWKDLCEKAKATMTSNQFKKWKQEAQRAIFHGKLDGKAAAKARARCR